MSKLDKIKEIADQRLKKIEMTEDQKTAVHYRIANAESGKDFFTRRRIWSMAGGGVVLAALLFAVLMLPGIGKKDVPGEKLSDKTFATESMTADAPEEAENDSDSVTSLPAPIHIAAVSSTPNGIAPDSAFTVSTGSPMSAEELESCLKIEPDTGYSLDANSDGSYTLTPAKAFDNGTVITLSLDYREQHYAWAFQTDASLSILAATPGADSDGVPANTGIEISFSSAVSSGAEKYISISPAADGKFLYNGRTVVFSPSEELKTDTIYTVTVSGALTGDSGDKLGEDYVFSFRTCESYDFWENRFCFTDNSVTSSFVSGDTAAIPVYAGNAVEDSTISCRIFKLDNHKAYLDLSEKYYDDLHAFIGRSYDVVLPTEGLETFLTTECTLQTLESARMVRYIVLPELEKGWYLAEFTLDKDPSRKLQRLIQISDLSVYTQSLNGEALVWVNSAETGEAVSDAGIELYSEKNSSARTSSDGTAMLSYVSGGERMKLIISKGDDRFVDMLPTDSAVSAQQYRSTIYLDRNEYMPTDTVHYWGMVLPCNGAELPSVLDVMLESSGSPRKVGTVEVSSEGIFTGELELVSEISAFHTLSFTSGSETAASTYFHVSEYVKPAYILSIAFDKEYYRHGEPIKAEITGTFFDGTPAAGLELCAEGSGGFSKNLTLDDNGKAYIEFVPKTYEEGWSRRWVYCSVSTSGAEDGYVSTSAYTYIFPSDYMTTVDCGEDSSVTIQSNAIDFKAYEEHENDFMDCLDELRGSPAEISGTLSVFKNWYEKKKTGTTYDFINKVTVPVYDYEYHEETVYTESFTTSGGSYVSTGFTPDNTEDAWYYVHVDYVTPDGVSLRESASMTDSRSYPPLGGSFYYLSADKTMLAEGETLRCQLTKNGETVEDGRLFCSAVQDRILDRRISADGSYSMVFDSGCIPNVIVCGAYFDGRHIYTVDGLFVRYDYHEKELNIELDTDETVYAPGDTVKAKLHIETAKGHDVETDFVIGVVDEAALAVNPQTVDPAADLYAACYFNEPLYFVSYTDPDTPTYYAEGGGDEGPEVRSEFPDTAAFITGRTDKNGDAEISFSLPDSLTSWRLTTVAATRDGYAGFSADNVAVSQNFFMNLVMNSTYLAGDELSFSSRVYGIADGSEVEYTVEVDGMTRSISGGKAGEYTFFNLGKMPCGSYDITIYAKCGEFSDAVRRTVRVKSSRLELMRFSCGDLAEGIQLDASRYPAAILFADGSENLYSRVLAHLLTAGGQRLDQIYAQKLAADTVEKLDPDAAAYFKSSEPGSYQAYTGGMCLTRYSSADAVTTAYALITIPEYINTAAARDYLQHILFSSTSEVELSAAYMGLAALREPVLKDVRQLAGQVKDDEAKYYLTCALALLGDNENASALFDALFRITDTDAYSYVNAGERELNYALSARAAMAAILLGAPCRDGLVEYLLTEQSEETLPNFPCMVYLRHALPSSEKSSFTCNYNGEKQSFELNGGQIKVLEFNSEELKKADFRVSGHVCYTAIYVGSCENVRDNASGVMDISCKVSENASVGSKMTVHVDVSFKKGCPGKFFAVDLALPSGMRFLELVENRDSIVWLTGEEDGHVTILLNREAYGKPLADSVSFKLRARAVLPGSFTFEAPILTGCDAGLTKVGTSSVVTIQ